MNAERSLSKGNKNIFLCLTKGALVALSISLILICVFAFLLRFLDIPSSAIKPVNQIIKIVSVVLGCFSGLKKVNEMGIVNGFAIGFIYTLLAFAVFSILNGKFCFESTLVNDLLFGGITGSISGVVCVNLKKK